MRADIAVLAGDGIGPEVTAEAAAVLKAVAARFGHEFILHEAAFGGSAIDQSGEPLPPRTLELCLGADAVLLGAIGGPKWSSPRSTVRPEQGLLRLRQELGVYANLRPVKGHPGLRHASTLKAEVIEAGDPLFLRGPPRAISFGAKA